MFSFNIGELNIFCGWKSSSVIEDPHFVIRRHPPFVVRIEDLPFVVGNRIHPLWFGNKKSTFGGSNRVFTFCC